MRETLRDVMLTIAAAGALFAAFLSWTNHEEIQTNREELRAEIASVREELRAEIASVREELRAEIAELRGMLRTTSDTVIAHVNAGGVHLNRDVLAVAAGAAEPAPDPGR